MKWGEKKPEREEKERSDRKVGPRLNAGSSAPLGQEGWAEIKCRQLGARAPE